jgi:hypothetical protein
MSRFSPEKQDKQDTYVDTEDLLWELAYMIMEAGNSHNVPPAT